MLRVFVSLTSLALLLTACGFGSSKQTTPDQQEDFTQNQTYSRSYKADYKVACDAGRRALLSQGYSIDKSSGDTVSGHKNFIDKDGRNTQITFNVNCSPNSTGPDNSQVFANAIQDSFSLKKSTTAASVGVSIIGSVSLPFMSSDDALVKTSSLTVTRPQFYGGFFDLLQQYLAAAQLEQPQTQAHIPPGKTEHAPVPAPTPAVPLTPENTGIAKPAPEPAAAPTTPKTETAPAAAPVTPASTPAPTSTPASTPSASPAPTHPATPSQAPVSSTAPAASATPTAAAPTISGAAAISGQ